MPARPVTRRRFIIGAGATLAAPAVVRFSLKNLYAQDFGLKADGQTNDLPALRTMLAEAERKGRGTIQLPAGRILLEPNGKESALLLPANVELEGAGADKTTLFMADGVAGHVINAPFGWVHISSLTIDGNESKRPGTVGHNIRVNGDKVLIEHVRCINAVSYGIAVGQKHYARDVTIRDVEIINAGADGIDVKNWLKRTEGIVIENVTVRGFGRPDPALDPKLIGSSQDKRGAKAAVDLRGNCQVRGLTIIGILPHRDGLRFRIGEVGANGSSASNVKVRGTKGQSRATAISVGSPDIELQDVDIADATFAIVVAAPNLKVVRGQIERSGQAAVLARATQHTRPDQIRFQSVAFKGEAKFVFQDVDGVRFDDCSFSECRERIQQALAQDARIVLNGCRFDSSCG
jgi:hypothetical protein